MQKKIIEFNKDQRGKNKMDFQSGDIVKVHLKIKEAGKERVQVFEGLVIAVKSRQSSSPTITVRKISHGVGVEMIMPLLSKNVEKIDLIKKAKVRRSKLYYVRKLTAKQSRMKYKDLGKYLEKEEDTKESSEITDTEAAGEKNEGKKDKE